MRLFFLFVPLALLLLASPARAQGTPKAAPRIHPGSEVQGLSAPILLVLRQAGVRDLRGHFLLATDSQGANPRIRFAGAEVPDSVRPMVARIVANYLAHQDSRRPIALSFRLDGPANAELEWPPAIREVTRVPEIINRSRLLDLMRGIAAAYPSVRNVLHPRAQLRLLVDSEGQVEYVVLTRPTGNDEIDQYLMSLAYEIRARPAYHDGQAANAWVIVPITISGEHG